MHYLIQFYLAFGFVYATNRAWVVHKSLRKLGEGAFVRVGGKTYENAVERGQSMATTFRRSLVHVERTPKFFLCVYIVLMVWEWFKEIFIWPRDLIKKIRYKEFVWVNKEGLIRTRKQ